MMGKTAEKKDPDRDRVDADRCWKSWRVTYGHVLFVSSADAVMATPRAAMAAIFCSKISSKDWITLEAAPKNLFGEHMGNIVSTRTCLPYIKRQALKDLTYDASNSCC